MFEDNKITKTIFSEREAVDSTETVDGLWNWAAALHKTGVVFAWIFGALAIVALFAIPAAIGGNSAIGVLIGLGAAVVLGLLAALNYFVFHTLALMVSSSASTTYNTMVAAKAVLTLAEFSHAAPGEERRKDEQDEKCQEGEPDEDCWYCTNCGHKNGINEERCGECGTSKRDGAAMI